MSFPFFHPKLQVSFHLYMITVGIDLGLIISSHVILVMNAFFSVLGSNGDFEML